VDGMSSAHNVSEKLERQTQAWQLIISSQFLFGTCLKPLVDALETQQNGNEEIADNNNIMCRLAQLAEDCEVAVNAQVAVDAQAISRTFMT
jgi:flagella basal body P-ring formation protein FlgA